MCIWLSGEARASVFLHPCEVCGCYCENVLTALALISWPFLIIGCLSVCIFAVCWCQCIYAWHMSTYKCATIFHDKRLKNCIKTLMLSNWMDNACKVCCKPLFFGMLHSSLALTLYYVSCRFLWGGGGTDRPVCRVAQAILPGILLWAFCKVVACSFCGWNKMLFQS